MALPKWAVDFLKRQVWLRPLRLARLARRSWRERPDWSPLYGDGQAGGRKGKGAPRVLIGTSVGLHLAVSNADSLFAAALLARGAEVEVLLCDGALPACMACEANWYPDLDRFVSHGASDLCQACFPPAEKMFAAMPVTLRRYSDFITAEDRAWAQELASACRSRRPRTTSRTGCRSASMRAPARCGSWRAATWRATASASR